MSVQTTNSVWKLSKAKGSELLVLLAIADNAHEDNGICWPSIEYLSEKTRLSKRQVIRIVAVIETMGELQIRHRKQGNIYRITLNDDSHRFCKKCGILHDPHNKILLTDHLCDKCNIKSSKYNSDIMSLYEPFVVTSCHQKVTSRAPESDTAMSPDPLEPSINHKKISEPQNGSDASTEKSTPDIPQNLMEFVAKEKESKQRHIKIIGWFAEQTKPEFKTKAQWDAFRKRHLRAARKLADFDTRQIVDAYKHTIGKPYITEYSLDTIFKELTNGHKSASEQKDTPSNILRLFRDWNQWRGYLDLTTSEKPMDHEVETLKYLLSHVSGDEHKLREKMYNFLYMNDRYLQDQGYGLSLLKMRFNDIPIVEDYRAHRSVKI